MDYIGLVGKYNPIISDTRVSEEYQDDTQDDDNEYHHINWIIDKLFNTPLIENLQ